ncbi:hypothetical protein [Catellatospora chokoriensis]|uniref:Transposase IS116/IS110/IS902 family protein n=1 Tax=Catellatospora chokoriensis TaxID=310353 RepID=A0A8J3KAQ7_9ACTN|nr:hypothetical protein [Catellatospora chokoriensis]GIF93795.1 hypothetical protein Cch02nite_72390 [Catellatospora chokoriensis]
MVAEISRTNTFLGERYRRLARRRGKKRAIVALGNSVLTIVWHLLSDPNAHYQDLGPNYYESKISQRRRQRDLIRQLEHLTGQKVNFPTRHPNYPPRPNDALYIKPGPATRRRELPLPTHSLIFESASAPGTSIHLAVQRCQEAQPVVLAFSPSTLVTDVPECEGGCTTTRGANVRRRDQLILKYPALDAQLNGLYKEMSASRALRESFLRDPSGVIWSQIFKGEVASVRSNLSSANRLLYCFLADPGMRRWAEDYSREMAERFSHLRDIRDPVERKREFLLAIDRDEVARDFARALSNVGGLELQTAIVSNEGKLNPVDPLAAVAGPVFTVVVVVIAAAALFVAVAADFVVHQHNAFTGPENGREPGPEPAPEPVPAEEIIDWLGLTRANLRTVANVLGTAMSTTAQELYDQGALSQGSEELQASLDRLSVEGRI